jgi:hypothetical protein
MTGGSGGIPWRSFLPSFLSNPSSSSSTPPHGYAPLPVRPPSLGCADDDDSGYSVALHPLQVDVDNLGVNPGWREADDIESPGTASKLHGRAR